MERPYAEPDGKTLCGESQGNLMRALCGNLMRPRFEVPNESLMRPRLFPRISSNEILMRPYAGDAKNKNFERNPYAALCGPWGGFF